VAALGLLAADAMRIAARQFAKAQHVHKDQGVVDVFLTIAPRDFDDIRQHRSTLPYLLITGVSSVRSSPRRQCSRQVAKGPTNACCER
jgi:hypothetical protein